MRAVRGNKEYIIDETQQKFYQDAGYDILDDSGKVVAYGRGKTVSYGDYAALKEENAKLQAELTALKEKNAKLQAELTALKEKNANPEGATLKDKAGKKAGE